MGGAMAGSVVGHGISNMLFGGSRPAEQAAAPPPAEYAQQSINQTGGCDIPAKGELRDRQGRRKEADDVDFTKCLEATGGDMNSCAYYLEALSELICLLSSVAELTSRRGLPGCRQAVLNGLDSRVTKRWQ